MYTYDGAGRLLSSQQNAQSPGSTQTRSVAYDGLGRKTSETSAETGTTSLTYDSPDSSCTGSSAGDLVESKDNAGNVTCYAYDLQHRLLSSSVSGTYATTTPSSYFVYDSATMGTTSMRNVKGALAEAYTKLGGVKKTDEFFSYVPQSSGTMAGGVQIQMWQSTPNSGGYFSTQETYYPNGALGSRTSVLGAASYGYPTISYGLDGEGRPTTATDTTNSLNLITGTSYNVAGLPTSVTFGNSSSGAADVDTFQYDANTNRPISIANTVNASSGPWLMNTGLTWWPNGSLQQMTITDSGDTTKNQTCNYSADDLGRLAIANCGCSTWAQSYSYDAFGNINKSLISGGTGTTYSAAYSSGSNHVSGGPSYDANGNQLSSTGLSSISWNAYGQAVSVSAIANEPYTGTYDAAGRLVEITLPSGGTQQFVYSPSGAKIAVVNNGTLIKGTVSLPGGDTAIYNFGGLSYLRHTDWLGSSRLATTWNHGVYSKESYAPFGETYNEGGTPDRSFTGQDQDVVTGSQGTGIYEFMFRKYDPAAGRWLSPDPLGWGSASLDSPQSLNRYAYVMNYPLNSLDSKGLGACISINGNCS
jgi:RHS repeat-associated protein